jgi:hypothetical protein
MIPMLDTATAIAYRLRHVDGGGGGVPSAPDRRRQHALDCVRVDGGDGVRALGSRSKAVSGTALGVPLNNWGNPT